MACLMSEFDDMADLEPPHPFRMLSAAGGSAGPVARLCPPCGSDAAPATMKPAELQLCQALASVEEMGTSPTSMVVRSDVARPSVTQKQVRKANLETKLVNANPTVRKQAETALVALSQRGSGCFYSSDWAFPNQRPLTVKNILAKESFKVVEHFVCKGLLKCPGSPPCCSQVDAMDVCQLRNELLRKCETSDERHSFLCTQLSAVWDRTAQRFGKLKLALSEYSTVDVCPVSFALVFGFTESQLRKALDEVKDSRSLVPSYAIQDSSASVPLVSAESPAEADSILRGYVLQVLLQTGEMNPAPLGSARSEETVIRKQSWALHWKQCQEHFQGLGRTAPGSKNKLKTIMKAERRLVQKTVNSHPKCQSCVLLAARWQRAVKTKGQPGKELRRLVREEIARHERNHMGERKVLDSHAYLSIAQPHRMWTILCDAATQRNTRLPKLFGRPAKDLVNGTWFNFKLMGTYAPGFGFTPYLLHNSASGGDNLVWTVIWDTIKRMNAHYGYTADELFILLDNTTSDNKNMTMIGVCAWLVATGKFRRVRVFFLMVGHTHVVIDQIFGVITTGLRQRQLLLPEDMMNGINRILDKSPQYQPHNCAWLRTVFDWKSFVRDDCKLFPTLKNLFRQNNYVVDAKGHLNSKFNGWHDIHFNTTEPSRKLNCHICYRQSSAEPLLPSDRNGILCFLDAPPHNTEPKLCPIKPIDEWGNYKKKDAAQPQIYETVSRALRDADWKGGPDEERRVTAEWTNLLNNIADYAKRGLPREFHLRFDDFLPNRIAPELPQGEMASLLDYDFDNMSNPPVDPVVCGSRTPQQILADIKALRGLHRLCVGPSIDPKSPAYEGDFVLLKDTPSVNLAKIDNRTRADAATLEQATYMVSVYENTPVPGRPGLWGTFLAPKGVAAKKVSHSDILVFHAATKPASEPRTVFVHRSTLIELARALPDDATYAIPSVLPESHCGGDSEDEEYEEAERLERRAARRQQTRAGQTHEPAGSKRKQPKKQKKKKKDDDEDEESAEDDEGENDDDDDEEEDDEDEEEEDEEEVDVKAPTHLLTNYRVVENPTFDHEHHLIDPTIDFKFICVWAKPPPNTSGGARGKRRAADSSPSEHVWLFGRIVKDYVRETSRLHSGGWSHDYNFMLIHDAKADKFLTPKDFGRSDLGVSGVRMGIKLDELSYNADCWVPMIAAPDA